MDHLYSSSQQQESEALFQNLVPIEPTHKVLTNTKLINAAKKQKLDRDLQKRHKSMLKRGTNRTERSRSRQKGRNHHQNQNDNRVNDQQRGIIVISDDQMSQVEFEGNDKYKKYRDLQRNMREAFQNYPKDGMNWRERQKIDRKMDQGMRNYIQGKLRDQLSNQVFNTIEAYFK